MWCLPWDGRAGDPSRLTVTKQTFLNRASWTETLGGCPMLPPSPSEGRLAGLCLSRAHCIVLAKAILWVGNLGRG